MKGRIKIVDIPAQTAGVQFKFRNENPFLFLWGYSAQNTQYLLPQDFIKPVTSTEYQDEFLDIVLPNIDSNNWLNTLSNLMQQGEIDNRLIRNGNTTLLNDFVINKVAIIEFYK